MPYPPTPSQTASNTPTPSITASVTPTYTPTETPCIGVTPTQTPSNTATQVTPTPTITPTPSITQTSTPTGTIVVTPTNTSSPTNTPTQTPSPTTPANCVVYKINNNTFFDVSWNALICNSETSTGGTIPANTIGYTSCVQQGTLGYTGTPIITIDAIC